MGACEPDAPPALPPQLGSLHAYSLATCVPFRRSPWRTNRVGLRPPTLWLNFASSVLVALSRDAKACHCGAPATSHRRSRRKTSSEGGVFCNSRQLVSIYVQRTGVLGPLRQHAGLTRAGDFWAAKFRQEEMPLAHSQAMIATNSGRTDGMSSRRVRAIPGTLDLMSVPGKYPWYPTMVSVCTHRTNFPCRARMLEVRCSS